MNTITNIKEFNINTFVNMNKNMNTNINMNEDYKKLVTIINNNYYKHQYIYINYLPIF